ncbi:hypothetical protein [Pandoraea sp. PE-S2T-3]|uniref:hypothetical protein n=1 Tax=Pandoraea sp. PE-S2T-3 TaxID=1986993 RepID=UPI001124EB66|nr:hypothetical protein [Pandoraea sp. PE-S2T-3]
MNEAHSIRLCVRSEKLELALRDLAGLAERLPNVVQSFFDGLLGSSDLVCFHSSDGAAGTAGEIWIRLEPSDRLLGLLAAFPTGNLDGLGVQAEGHEHS